MKTLYKLYPDKFDNIDQVRGNITIFDYNYLIDSKFHLDFPKMANESLYCRQKDIIAKVIRFFVNIPMILFFLLKITKKKQFFWFFLTI
jgi:hypothetical protein